LGAFEGKVAVITGGGTGVGAAIALALAAEGSRLCLIGRRPRPLAAIAAKAQQMGVDAISYSVDLASDLGHAELAQRLARDLPGVDLLVQNAAINVSGAIDGARLQDLDKQYRTNVRAPYALTQALLPMLKSRHGQVVFINSSSGITAKAMSAQYDATKHALKAIADSLRAEVNPQGIRVLSVYLGRTATEMQARIHAEDDRSYRPELLLQPEDVASVVLNALSLPRTAEVTDIHIRPMIDNRKSGAA